MNHTSPLINDGAPVNAVISKPSAERIDPAPKPGPDKPLSIEQTAEFFGVTKRTLMRWMGKRLISYVKVGASTNARVFFFPEDITGFAARLRRNARS